MLNTQTTLSIIGTSMIDVAQEINGEIITSQEVMATMYYNISEDGMVSENTNIINRDLYEKNINIVRADIDEFTALCRLQEDEMFG